MAKVTLKNVDKIYPAAKGGEVRAVSDLSLEVQDGEFVVLAGPSGAGKSTALRMIAGLEEISRGEIFIGDRQVNDVSPQDRDIAMVFANGALYPHLSVYENLAFGLQRRRFPKAEIKKRVEDATAILGLEKSLALKPTDCTTEERQRVAVGRAIVRRPKVFLFDEPLCKLDSAARMQMRTEIIRLHQRLEATMIYGTRDPVEAMTMADRIVVMNNGVVQQSATPLTLYDVPANLFVAGFLGSPPMNFIHGTLREERGNLLFCEREGGTMEARLSETERPEAREFLGKPMLLGIRPENIEVAQVAKAQANSATSFPALLDVVEPMGGETNLYLETGSHTLICRSQRVFERGLAGQRMRFEMNLETAHLFDAMSGRRVI